MLFHNPVPMAFFWMVAMGRNSKPRGSMNLTQTHGRCLDFILVTGRAYVYVSM